MCGKIPKRRTLLEKRAILRAHNEQIDGCVGFQPASFWADVDRSERPTFVHQVARVLRRYQCSKVDQDPFRAARAP